MNVQEIPRMKFSPEKEIQNARVELARNARQKLGYKVLSCAIAESNSLLYTLKQLNIPPMDKNRVRAYMNSKEKQGMWSGTRNGIIGIAAIIFFASLFVTGMSRFPIDKPWPNWIYGVNTTILLCGLTSVIFTIWNGASERWGRGTRKNLGWERYGVDNYEGNIPEFALSKALEIKEHCPEAQFGIYQLTETSEERKAPIRMPDPFLFAYVGGGIHPTESYYIDVWDEKEYEL